MEQICCFCEEEQATEWHNGDGYCYNCALSNYRLIMNESDSEDDSEDDEDNGTN